MMVKAFTLIEILVSLLIAATIVTISGSLFPSVFDYLENADAADNRLSFERAAILLTSDVQGAIRPIGSEKKFELLFGKDEAWTISLIKPTYLTGSVNFQTMNVVWLFDGKYIKRFTDPREPPLILSSTPYKINFFPIGANAYQMYLRSDIKVVSIVIGADKEAF